MNFFQKHSFVHYLFHTAVASFLLLVLVFSENIFPQSFSYASNLVFGTRSLTIEGEVYQKLSFEVEKVKKDGVFFQGASFITKDNSGVDLAFSDFSVVRSGENTSLTIGTSSYPDISLDAGKIWVSTKEYVVTHVPQAKVETLAGSVVIDKNSDGKTVITAWDKPSRITFLSPENDELWSFLLPSRHQVEFVPRDFFSAEDFDQLRFSKLKKEFPIKKVAASEFIKENIGKDSNWHFKVLQNIEDRKAEFFGVEMKSSLFSFSPNTQNKEQEEFNRSEVMNIWDELHKKNFRMFEKKLEILSPQRQKEFYKYAGFYPHLEKSTPVFVKSFPEEVGLLWKDLWYLESIVAGGLDTKFEQDRLRKSIMKEAIESEYDPEEIQFFAVSLFKNYADEISYAIIDFFYDANAHLIAIETSPQKQLTRKLEIVNDVFSFTENLIEREEYLLARKVLDKVETYVAEDTSPLLVEQKKKILEQKDYIRGEVEYAEILGDEKQEHLGSYLSIKENAQKQLEEQNLHAAPTEEEFSLKKAQMLFEENNITFKTLEQDNTQKHLFSFEKEETEEGILFSGQFNLKTEKFSDILVYKEQFGKQIERKDLYTFTFSFFEITGIDDEILTALFAESPEDDTPVENIKAIPSEIADLVHTLTQDSFIKNDVMIHSYNLDVVEINTAKIEGAIAHYEALEKQKSRAKRKNALKEKKEYSLNTAYSQVEEFTFDCFYNVETFEVFNITGYAYDEKILLPGSMSIEDMIASLDKKAKKIREKIELKSESVLHLKSIGIEADEKNIKWKDANTLHITDMTERSTRVQLNGVYKPFSQKFSELTFLNIASEPVVLKKQITLYDLEADFSAQNKVLKEKVNAFSE